MSLNYGASSAFYLVITILVFLLAIGADKYKSCIFPAMIFFLLTLVAGLRAYDVGTDTAEYVRIFNTIQNGGTFTKEIGFSFLSKILLFINSNPTFLFLVYAVITYGLIIIRFWDFKDKISFSFAILSFYSFFFFESLNVLRQFLGIAIVFYATRYLFSRKYIKFCILTIIAASFHTSAVLGFIFLGVEFLSWKDLNKKQKRFLICLSFVGIAMSGYVVSTINNLYFRYRHYFLAINRNVGLRLFALIVIFFVSILPYRKRRKKQTTSIGFNQSDSYFIRTARVSYLIACGLGSLGYFYDYMARVGFYFYPYIFVYFGVLVRDDNLTRRIIFKSMICFVIIYVLFQYIFLLNGSGHHPYHVVWN